MTKLKNTAERFDVNISKAIESNYKEGSFKIDKAKACVKTREIPCCKQALKGVAKEEKKELCINRSNNYYYNHITEEFKTAVIDLITKKV